MGKPTESFTVQQQKQGEITPPLTMDDLVMVGTIIGIISGVLAILMGIMWAWKWVSRFFRSGGKS